MQKPKIGRGLIWIVGGGFFLLSVLVLLSFLSGREGPGGGKIGLVEIEGVILDSKEVLQQLDKHQNNRSIKAVVVRINSPGGGVAAAQEIHEELEKTRLQHRKPVIVSMGSLAASGGYYIACASDRIFANPGSITGSIGVIMQLTNISQLLQKVGVKSVVIKSGEHKDMGSMVKEMTAEEKRLFQEVLDDAYNQFIEAVVSGRKMNKERVQELADGRIFTGRQAKSLGLVDELGDLPDAINFAAQMAGIRGKPKVVLEKKRRLSLLDFLLGSSTLGSSLLSPEGRGSMLSIQYLMR